MLQNILIILNLFMLESLLSVDNAAVLAIMVKDFPQLDQPKALKFGIAGAFLFRGLCLLTAAWLVKILWLKIVGGCYLLYLTYGHFTPAKDTLEEGIDKNRNPVYNLLWKSVGHFWATVILVEVMDLAFSIDNIFAAVAMTNQIYLILIGVFIGIISMRFVAQFFTVLITRFPSLETSAFIVIALLGFKLIFSGGANYIPSLSFVETIMSDHYFDFAFSFVMMAIFFAPLIFLRKREIKIIW